jgi:hypothetical protein
MRHIINIAAAALVFEGLFRLSTAILEHAVTLEGLARVHADSVAAEWTRQRMDERVMEMEEDD